MLEKVIENWTSRLDYIRASRGSPMPEIKLKSVGSASSAASPTLGQDSILRDPLPIDLVKINITTLTKNQIMIKSKVPINSLYNLKHAEKEIEAVLKPK
ncbi:hypothetical protein TNCV_2044471 [Trichonephila clavipes]|nr:hypothetical protein TNCV_2044471 [Trichonephila clavipes]